MRLYRFTIRIFAVLSFCLGGTLFSNRPAVLVTGGAGYIGSHTCKALDEAGFLPITYDSLIFGSEELVKWGPFIKGNILEREKLRKVFEKYRPVAVMHFAGLRDIAESFQNPADYYETNVAGSLNLFKVMKEENVNNLILSSTCTVYGDTQGKPMTEDLPHFPNNPYSASKSFMERIATDFSRAYGMKHIILRYFNAAGVDCDAGLKRLDCSKQFLIPAALTVAKEEVKPLSIFGSDYPTPDGTTIRDYIHTSDLAKAHVLALRFLLERQEPAIFNLGTGRGYSILEVLKMVRKVSGKQFPIQRKPARAGDLPETVADPSRSEDILQFTPEQSSLQWIVESENRALHSE